MKTDNDVVKKVASALIFTSVFGRADGSIGEQEKGK